MNPVVTGPPGRGRLVSVQVGAVRTHVVPAIPGHDEREWRTGYFKAPVDGPVNAGRLGLAGDEQFDLTVHGGPDRALLAYSADHYPLWRAELALEAIGPGGFGENLTIADLDESKVCVGDTWAIGRVRAQITQPRGPCSNISRRWRRPDLIRRVAETSRFGWYLRVLVEGMVEAGMDVALIERPYPDLDVARVFQLRVHPQLDPDAVARLAVMPELTPEVRRRFAAHAERLAASPES